MDIEESLHPWDKAHLVIMYVSRFQGGHLLYDVSSLVDLRKKINDFYFAQHLVEQHALVVVWVGS